MSTYYINNSNTSSFIENNAISKDIFLRQTIELEKKFIIYQDKQ